ncbi:hypothetical protein [Lentzea sp. E54]|uniref:hypothetical protein n=1 Tax=Lentzea xerophila TaxID=3435883 RepID=UPI003DA656F7
MRTPAAGLTFDGPPTCGGEAVHPNEVCVDFSGRRYAVDYETMLEAQKESVGITALWRAGIPGMLGAVALALAVWRRISSEQTMTTRDAFLNVLAFVTVPLLVVAAVLQLLGARLGWTWASPVGIPGLSQGALTAIVTLAITLYVPFAWSDERPSAEAPAQPLHEREAEYERVRALERAAEAERQHAKAAKQREKAEQREAREPSARPNGRRHAGHGRTSATRPATCGSIAGHRSAPSPHRTPKCCRTESSA